MISHHHKTIFVHVPKCGGQSIETMFLNDVGLNWRTRAPLLLRRNDQPLLGPPRLAHLLAREYLRFKYLSEEQFETYYKFAIVRCPYKRVVSFFNYLPGHWRLNKFVSSWLPKEFAHRETYANYPHQYEGKYHFVRPQTDFLFDEDEKLLVDDVFRLDDIQDHLGTIRERSGVVAPLEHRNKSKGRLAQVSDLTDRHRQTIRELYEKDFDLLGFTR